MESIAVIKPDMTVVGQGSLSPFGLLSRLFTEELVRRGTQTIGSYRPLHLAYLEEDEEETQQAPQEIHFDLNVELLVNRLLRDEREEKKKQEKTPEQRILERVILREREIRTAHQETRRVVLETDGRHITSSLPARLDARTFEPNTREAGQKPRQTGEERSTKNESVPHRSAGLTRVFPAAAQHKAGMAAGERTLTLASLATSAPASGGWTPKEREAHPGYPARAGQPINEGMGSILLPDVLRRRREQALKRRESLPAPSEAFADETADDAELAYRLAEDAIAWGAEGAEQTPESERALYEVRRAVEETLRRNERRREPVRETADGRASKTERAVGQAAAPTLKTVQADMEAAVPASEEAGKQTTAPAELIYRESEGEAENGSASETARTAAQTAAARAAASTAVPASEEASKQTTAPTELIYRESEGETESGSASEAVQTAAQTATARAAASTAVPASEETAKQTAAPAELIYRESKGETADGRASETARTAAQTATARAVAQTAVPASEGAGKQTAAPAELIYRESEDETTDGRASETARTAAQTAAAQAVASTAVPASEEAAKQTAAPAELIYRESKDETTDGRASETAQTAVPARDELLGEQILRPISLYLRAESEKPTARDIRTAKAQSAKTTVTSAHRTRQAMHITAEQTAYQGIANRDAHLPVMGVPTPETAEMPTPAELVFAASASDTEAEQREKKTAAHPTERAKQESAPERLPTWARELMEQAGVTDTAGQSAAFFAMNGGAATQQINWTAPTAISAPSARSTAEPAQMSFKERKESEEAPYRQPVSDAELRRTAEKVYKIIEERLRRELRRSGR